MVVAVEEEDAGYCRSIHACMMWQQEHRPDRPRRVQGRRVGEGPHFKINSIPLHTHPPAHTHTQTHTISHAHTQSVIESVMLHYHIHVCPSTAVGHHLSSYLQPKLQHGSLLTLPHPHLHPHPHTISGVSSVKMEPARREPTNQDSTSSSPTKGRSMLLMPSPLSCFLGNGTKKLKLN